MFQELDDQLWTGRVLAEYGEVLADREDIPAARARWQEAARILDRLHVAEAESVRGRLAETAETAASGDDTGTA